MRAYTRGARCLMQLLQEALDDPSAEPCGRCSVCLGRLPEGIIAAPSVEVARAVAASLRGQAQAVEPRRMWPGGAYGAKGRIPAGLQAEPGRALAYADAPEWREVVEAVFARDAPAPDELVAGCVELLSRWRESWDARPEIVVGLPAAGYPLLVGGVVEGIAARGRLPTAGLGVAAPVAAGLSSPEEAAHWREALVVPADTERAAAGRVVLLVVDATSSRWPITVATARLREAGAEAVAPLVLHLRP